MAGNFADLTAVLTLDSTRFSEEAARVKKELGETSDLADLMAGRVSQSFKKQASAVEQGLSRQALAAQKAGMSVGQYKAAMRMLPMQFTDVATQLAGGQNPWLILLQQGGQVKDSFGGMIPMFRGLAGAISLPMSGSPRWRWRPVRWRMPGTRGIPRFQRLIKPWFFPVISQD
ncbi:minor tail protein H domain protein [Escherichia coli O91:H21 str. B2F1]|nr:minor tail protein H domain protein [Escherichia coli O91:H21 str. B2F1]